MKIENIHSKAYLIYKPCFLLPYIKFFKVVSFYIFFVIGVAAGSFIGWMVGFTKMFLLILKLLLPLAAAYYCHGAVAAAISSIIPGIAEWAIPLGLVVVAGCCFVLLHWLHKQLVKSIAAVNKTILNKSVGAAAGMFIAAVCSFFFVQQAAVFALPQNLQAIANVINKPIVLANQKAISIFQQPTVLVMAADTVHTIPVEGTKLKYITDDFTIRSNLEKQMLQLVNAERNKHGLKALTADSQLATAARIHSSDMLRRGYFSHNTPEGITPFQRLHKLNIVYLYAGENLAMAPTLLKAHEGLMRSPGHRANILNPSYGRIGIGIAESSKPGLMITQEFRN